MIIKDIKIFSQNVRKNYLIVNTILETKLKFNIIFVQEPSWTTISSVLSSRNCKGNELVGVSNYPNWLTFPSNLIVDNDCPRVVTCDNIRLLSLHFLLHKEKKFVIVKERNQQNISVVKDIFSNIYSDSSQSALKYLKDIEVNI